MEDKKMLFSGIQPSGIVTIGNYIGAIKNWKKLQNDYNCIFSIVDLHAITVKQEPAKLRANSLELLALYIASGIDPDKSVIFIQSHVPAHAELCWILNTISYPGELSRMTQFKDKSKKNYDNINMGLMDYPVLMAADILLYQTELVPVGADQKQHLELSRDLAIRFNNRYSETFKVAEPYICKHGAKIMSLTDPTKKMSKSDDNINGFISMSDGTDTIIRKFKKATTDSDNRIIFDKEKAGISNLLTIYSAFTDINIKDAEKEFEGKGYGEFKQKVGEAVADGIKPIQEEKDRILKDKTYLNSIINNGADRASKIAYKTLGKVYKKMGLYIRERN
jgi:tryptophanyl-tRNA synthetase